MDEKAPSKAGKNPVETEAAGSAAETVGYQLGAGQSLVPSSSIAGRALVTVIAIMTFLASLTAGSACLIANASDGWRSQISQEVTVQVRPTPDHNLDEQVQRAAEAIRAAPGIQAVHIFTGEESARLLEPWLGTGLDLSELPVPRMIVVERNDQATEANLEQLRKNLAQRVAGASLDDHRLWLDRLATMAGTVEIGAVLLFFLMILAMGLAVAFATHGAMAENREIIEVLHFVGAKDAYIAGQFQNHFLRLGFIGGLLGTIGASALFLCAHLIATHWTATPQGQQIEALFGDLSLSLGGYAIVGAIALMVAVLTAALSRGIVYRHLAHIY